MRRHAISAMFRSFPRSDSRTGRTAVCTSNRDGMLEQASLVVALLESSEEEFRRLFNKISFHNDLRIESICQIIVKTSFVFDISSRCILVSFTCVLRYLCVRTIF